MVAGVGAIMMGGGKPSAPKKSPAEIASEKKKE